MTATTRLSVLGTTILVRDGEVVPLPRAKHRQVLAALALHPHRPVAEERLIDLVWGGRVPATARKTLQTYVSQLRRLLVPEAGTGELAILTDPGGYLLRIDPGSLDASRLEHLVGRARARVRTDPAPAHALLQQALDLWRGPPYEDLGDHPSLYAERSRLDELRQTAEELDVEAELELGRAEAVLPRVRDLVERSPFRSRPLTQLMLTLHRAGRTADALEAYRRADRRYRDELGIEPDPRLRDLQRRILAHDPDLLAGPDREAHAEAALPPLREQRWVALLAAAALPEDESLPVRALARTVNDYDGILLTSGAREATAAFGLPRGHEDDAERAARAGLAFLRQHPRAALAVEVGDASVAPVDDADPGSVSGEVFAATAERLRRARSPGLFIGPTAGAGLAHLFVGRAADEGWTAVERLSSRRRPLSTTPIFGRRAELELLASIWRRVVHTRRPHVVTLLGAAGVGKTRLAAEFLREAAADATVWRQRCLPYGDATYGALAALVRQVIGVADDAPPQEVSRRLDDWLARALDSDDLDREAHHRLSLLGLLGDIVEHKDAVATTTRRVIRALATEPTVIVVDDLHWAHDDLLDLLGAVARAPGERTPLLLLLVSREELLARRPDWGGGLPASSLLDLDALDEEDALEMASTLAPGRSALAERIAAAAGGNPLFMEELAAWVAQGGDLGELPATVRAIIGTRLDRLSTTERRLLGIGAVLGPGFSRDALAELADDGIDLDATLAVLLEQRLIAHEPSGEAPDGPYSFRHDLIAEAAYATIPEDDRAPLHRRAASYLEARPGAPAAPSILAHHWRRAGDESRALRYLLQAAREANQGWARDRAVAFYNRALELLGEDDPRRRQASLERAVALQAWAHVVLDVGHLRPAGDDRVRAGSRRG